MEYDAPSLLAMSQAELDDLFRASLPGPIPNGPADGTAIVLPGTEASPLIAEVVNVFDWKGKVFDAASGTLINMVGVTGVKAVVAQVYKAPSLMDGKECIVLDYSKTSFLAQKIRDEIRLVSPNFYLGRVYWANQHRIDFCLKF